MVEGRGVVAYGFVIASEVKMGSAVFFKRGISPAQAVIDLGVFWKTPG